MKQTTSLEQQEQNIYAIAADGLLDQDVEGIEVLPGGAELVEGGGSRDGAGRGPRLLRHIRINTDELLRHLTIYSF